MANYQMIQTEAKDSTGKQVLYISLELSNKKWKLTFGDGQRRRERTITSADLAMVQEELVKARKHFRLYANLPFFACMIPAGWRPPYVLPSVFCIMWWIRCA